LTFSAKPIDFYLQDSYSMIFKSLFANDGLVNRVLSTVGIPTVDWFQNAWAARWGIVIALVWRWTGYNMVFYLAGLQNIDYSIYEAARIDGASPLQQFVHLTIPLLKPTILLTAIMSTSGTLQLFDESVNLTAGGPGKATMTLTHYIYNISFVETPKFNYAAALSVFILVVVAVLSAIQMKVGDKRD
jgi:lactose/L-arabinose transport system permease protein